ncbi:MAG TPA: hypothetical protein VJN63_01425 [Thermoplasmata archaeon]|nr:hypothetical protein [Thermoplasmata archaeon]
MEDGNRWILSYDVDGHDRSTAVRVCQLIFGRRNTTTRAGVSVPYKRGGFIHRPGVVWVGQSVFILSERDAFELCGRLETMGVSVGLGKLVIDNANLDRFRRRRVGRSPRASS